jgi:hypothetical protein
MASPAHVVAEHLSDVEEFLSSVESTVEESDRHAELRRISPLIRFVRRFYRSFLHQEYGLRIHTFSYRDKRLVSRLLVRQEDRVNTDALPKQRALELAAMFEDMCDLLHGDLEFGYSEEDDDYIQFHQEAFPRWLNLLAEWLKAENEDALVSEVEEAESKYRHVFAEVF